LTPFLTLIEQHWSTPDNRITNNRFMMMLINNVTAEVVVTLICCGAALWKLSGNGITWKVQCTWNRV